MKYVQMIDLGVMEYEKALEIQKELQKYVMDSEDLFGFFLLVEHYPVLTIGKNGGRENLLYPANYIKELGIDIYETNRGGNVTYHGMGQIVGYPILNLLKFKKDVKWYVNKVEDVIITALKDIDIDSERKEKYRGVWVKENKICAIGISVKKWVTMHGFALNHQTDLNHFEIINPCGITERGVTSIQQVKGHVLKEKIVHRINRSFSNVFNCTLVNVRLEEVRARYDK